MPRDRGGPLRGPKNMAGGGSPPLIFGARRAGYGAAPPASRVLRIALARDSPAGCPGPRRPRRPLGSGRAVRPRACPLARRAARRGRRGGRLRYPDAREQSELAFDKQGRRKNYTNPGLGTGCGNLITAEPTWRSCVTKQGVHETRDAPVKWFLRSFFWCVSWPFSAGQLGRRRVVAGPGAAWPKSWRSGCEPAALAAESFPTCPPGP